MFMNKSHEIMVKSRGSIYIGTYDKNETTIDKKYKMNYSCLYIRVKCPYCGEEYDIKIQSFKEGRKCRFCCNEYENSFAYHIQVELAEPLNKYWDWEKNTVNPYLISKCSHLQVWIKCDNEINTHESHKVSCGKFIRGDRCPYCSGRKLSKENSFAFYLISKYGDDALNKYWDYNKNKLDPWEISKCARRDIWIYCQDVSYHNSYKTSPDRFNKGQGCGYCNPKGGNVHPKDSIAQWIIDNLGEDFLNRWSSRNNKSPWEMSKSSNKRIYLICPIHGEYSIRTCEELTRLQDVLRCNKCRSFAQALIDMHGEYMFEKLWSKDNVIDPWIIKAHSNKKVLIKCLEKDYHGDYSITPSKYMQGKRCGYCSKRSGKVHKLDSYGEVFPEKAKCWDYNKNKDTPYDIAPHANVKRWHICEKCGKSFERTLNSINARNCGVVCSDCRASEGETRIRKYIQSIGLIEHDDFEHDKRYFKDLVGVGGDILRPDFIFPKLKLWIEFNGDQHDKWLKLFQPKYEDFLKLQEHDRRKDKYAKNHGWVLIKIKQNDIDNIEIILDRIFKNYELN